MSAIRGMIKECEGHFFDLKGIYNGIVEIAEKEQMARDQAEGALKNLKEKYRWRNTDIDGWPNDGELVEFIINDKSLGLYAAQYIKEYCPQEELGKIHKLPLYWRPLDLPNRMSNQQIE